MRSNKSVTLIFTAIALLALLLASTSQISAAEPRSSSSLTFIRRDVQGLSRPSSGIVVDLDQDGDADLLKASDYGNTVAWWENNGSQVFAQHVIATGFGRARSGF